MNPLNAFLAATAFAYLACFTYTLIGKPPLANYPKTIQALFYALAFVLFFTVSIYPIPRKAYLLLGALYSFAAMGSFIGWPQVWMAYWTTNPKGSSGASAVGMAAWDLMIAVSFFLMS